MTATAQFKQVFSADDSWWQIRQGDFQLADDYHRDALEHVFTGDESYLADCDEAFACTITAVAPEHTAIQVGDIVVSDGCGSDKIFLRRV